MQMMIATRASSIIEKPLSGFARRRDLYVLPLFLTVTTLEAPGYPRGRSVRSSLIVHLAGQPGVACKQLLSIGLSELTKIPRYGFQSGRGEKVTEPHGYYRASRCTIWTSGVGKRAATAAAVRVTSRLRWGRFLLPEGNAYLSAFESRSSSATTRSSSRASMRGPLRHRMLVTSR